MVFTAEEKLMYEVMKALYDSGIPSGYKFNHIKKEMIIFQHNCPRR